MLDFGRDVCCDLAQSGAREWLVTNGIGGYASGTIPGVLTRRYHGLLVAALEPPLGRTLLLAKLDETATYDSGAYPLYVNRWADGTTEPGGQVHLERFWLEGSVPVWRYALGDALLEKRVWMQHGENTTFIRYELKRGSGPVTLSLRALVNRRDHHGNTHSGDVTLSAETVPHGLRITGPDGGQLLSIVCDRGSVVVEDTWVRDFLLDVETYRGLDDRDDHLAAGTFEARLEVGEALTVVASAEQEPETDGAAAYAARRVLDAQLIAQSAPGTAPQWAQQLTLAADQFIVRRPTDDDPLGRTVIAGYHWFGDWGRDTMIALPGLTLATGRPEEAAKILRTFARLVDQGMLPNRLPEAGAPPEYNTVDATLWYFEAARATYAQSGDTLLLRDLFPVLHDIIEWHLRGTRYHIGVDTKDGLLYAGEEGVQLTWMDAKIGDWVVTPRTGKPVEVNALWYNALCSMVEFARILDEPDDLYQAWADKAKEGFARFWNAEAQICYDVIDGPDGDDTSLRPNQLLAVSLHHSPLDDEQAGAVVDACARHLLTSYGLRSLSPDHADYAGHYGGNQQERDSVYHQGTVWGWLMGPFVAAHLRVYGDREQALDLLEGMARQLDSGCVGSLNEIYDGDPPFTPRGAVAQAWSVGEALRVWKLATEEY